MSKEKSIKENKLPDILKNMALSLKDLYSKDYQLNDNVRRICEIHIREIYNEDPDILLENLEKDRKTFSLIFSIFLKIEAEFAEKILNLLLLLQGAEGNLAQKQIKFNMIKKIIECHNVSRRSEGTYLGMALLEFKPKVVKKLIDLGIDVTYVDERSWTYIHFLTRHFVSQSSDFEEGESVTRAFASIALGDKCLKSATQTFASIAQILVRAGTNVNAQDKYGETALHYSAYEDDLLVTFYLIKIGAKTYIENNRGNTPLHCALIVESFKVAKLLLCYGYPIYENNEGKAPLDIAKEKNYTQIIEIIENMCPYFKGKVQNAGIIPAGPDQPSSKRNSYLLGNHF